MDLSRTEIDQFKSLAQVSKYSGLMWIALVQGYDCTIMVYPSAPLQIILITDSVKYKNNKVN